MDEGGTGDYVLLMDCDFTQILPSCATCSTPPQPGPMSSSAAAFRAKRPHQLPLQKILCNRCFHILASLLSCAAPRLYQQLNSSGAKWCRIWISKPHGLRQCRDRLKPCSWLQGRERPISWINRTPEMGQSASR